MNEALRVFDRLLKKYGYTIKRQPEFNLSPLKNFKDLASQEQVYNVFNSSSNQTKSNTESLTVCLRTCINETRAKGKRSELTGVNIEEHLIKCINSLLVSIEHASTSGRNVSLVIFDDRSDERFQIKLKLLCEQLTCDWQLLTTESPGQGESLYQNFEYAKNNDGLFYFCEDDYLHTETAVMEMLDFYLDIYEQTQHHLIIHPQEHENVFRRFNYPSYILYSGSKRWRTVNHATHVFFTHAQVVKEYWQYFENTKYVGIKDKRHLGSEKATTDNLFNYFPGFSPIPAVAIHLQEEHCLPPYYDWRALWDIQKNI